jgi:hypothetical protein
MSRDFHKRMDFDRRPIVEVLLLLNPSDRFRARDHARVQIWASRSPSSIVSSRVLKPILAHQF